MFGASVESIPDRHLVKRRVWEYPDIDTLKGKSLKGLSELRWRSGNVPHRLFGYRLSGHEYIVLIGCIHNKRKYKPTDALDTAPSRRKKIQNGEATYVEYKLVLNG